MSYREDMPDDQYRALLVEIDSFVDYVDDLVLLRKWSVITASQFTLHWSDEDTERKRSIMVRLEDRIAGVKRANARRGLEGL